MDMSLFYFADDSTPSPGAGRYDLLLSGARFADQRGFTAVWTPERHFHPFGGLYPNPSVTGAAVAAVTHKVGVRAGSVVAPLHSPLRIAEEWSVIDNISRGRAGVSLASGWHAADFALRPEAFSQRKVILQQSVATLRGLWRGEEMEVVDGTGATQRVRIYPPPVQSELPIWMTSAGSADTFRTAGALRVGLLTHLLGQDADELAMKIRAYREAAETASNGQYPGHVVLMVHTFLGRDEDETRELVREPFTTYLKSSFDLIAKSTVGDKSLDVDAIEEADIDFLVRRSFDRYYETSGVFGTVETAERTVERLAHAGVDEVACLIDFGVATERALAGLSHLADLHDQCAGMVARRW